jgi:anaerobic magnesium-protoporphyrin IX monomethyl ester cyclase
MAKVILIDSLGWQDGLFNLGLAYVAAGLKAAGHEAEVIDLNNRFRSPSQIADAIRDRNPQYIGFSVKSATFANAIELHKILLNVCPDATYIYGGPHVTLGGESILNETPAAFFFRGEAEFSLAEFVSKHCNGETDFRNIPGILHRDGRGRVQMSEVRYHCNLDDLPLPDFSVFDTFETFKTYPLLTSRGCPYRCTYCSVPTISGKKWIARSVESVMLELDYAVTVLKMNSVVIVDDNFTLNRERAESICRAIIERGYRFTWSCGNGIRADRIWPELARLMFEAGCREVAFGIESWDPEILASLSKGEERHQIQHGIEVVRAVGMKVTGFFMIGLPGSTYRKDLRSLAVAQRLQLDNYYFGLTVPYPGTALWQWAQKNARFLIPWQNSYHISEVFRDGIERIKLDPVFDTPEYPAEQRRKMFQAVQNAKARNASRSLRKTQRNLRSAPGRPMVVIRSSRRDNMFTLLHDLSPANPHVILWKGNGDFLTNMNPGVRKAYQAIQVPGPGSFSPEDGTEQLRRALAGCVVAFDVPGGLLEKYYNVLEFARSLQPRQILALVGEEFLLLPPNGSDAASGPSRLATSAVNF